MPASKCRQVGAAGSPTRSAPRSPPRLPAPLSLNASNEIVVFAPLFLPNGNRYLLWIPSSATYLFIDISFNMSVCACDLFLLQMISFLQ